MRGNSAISKVRLKSGSGCCQGILFVTVVVANSLLRASALKLTSPLFLDTIFKDGCNLLLVIASVPGARCFMASFNKNNTLSIAYRLYMNVSLLHNM